MKIENVLFDLGGVLYEIAPARMREAFAALSMKYGVAPERDELFKIFDDMERGAYKEEEFFHALRHAAQMPASDDEIRSAWNAILVGPYDFAPELSRKAAEKFRVALLSNTNRIHHDCFVAQTREVFAPMERLFFSFEIGLRKPDPEAFLHVVENAGFKPENTLFVEDTPANLETAKKLGFQVYHAAEPWRTFDELNILFKQS